MHGCTKMYKLMYITVLWSLCAENKLLFLRWAQVNNMELHYKQRKSKEDKIK